MILLDTSALVGSLTGSRPALPRLRGLLAVHQRLALPALVLYEWWRGPRTSAELAAQEALFPRESTLPFGWEEAAVAADLYRSLSRTRSRSLVLAVAACALRHEAQLWTLDRADYEDIPGLRLVATE